MTENRYPCLLTSDEHMILCFFNHYKEQRWKWECGNSGAVQVFLNDSLPFFHCCAVSPAHRGCQIRSVNPESSLFVCVCEVSLAKLAVTRFHEVTASGRWPRTPWKTIKWMSRVNEDNSESLSDGKAKTSVYPLYWKITDLFQFYNQDRWSEVQTALKRCIYRSHICRCCTPT